MKRLTCEMCGSTDMLKEDGVFVCQSCGIKYSVEEAKKMMIEGTVEVQGTVKIDRTSEVDNLLTRAFRYLDIGDFYDADDYCDRALDIDPKNVQAYLYQLLARVNVKKIEDLKNCEEPFDTYEPYKQIMLLGDESLKKTLKGYVDQIYTRLENERLESIYQEASNMQTLAQTENDALKAQELFESIGAYKDSCMRKAQCYEKAQNIKKKNEEAARRKEEAARLNEEACQRAKEENEKCKPFIRALIALSNEESDSPPANEMLEDKISSSLAQLNSAFAMNSEWNQIYPEYSSANDTIKSMQSDIVKLKDEETTLGFFAGKRKKEIAQIISNYEKEISFLKQKMQSIRPKLVEIIENELKQYSYSEDFVTLYKKLQNLKVGRQVFFGRYIWRVLDIKDGKALIISENAVDQKPFNTESNSRFWKYCTLRKWLNNDFFGSAFSPAEKAMIHTVKLMNEREDLSTYDQVFLLDKSEAEQYFKFKEDRICEYKENSRYAYKKPVCWWLRSYRSTSAFFLPTKDGVLWSVDYVEDNGMLVQGNDIDITSPYAVRPAMWIDI